MIARYIILFFALILIFSNSIGFDLYSHSAMYYFHNEAYGAFYNFFNIIVLPRYFLLSYIYEFFSVIGIPTGIVVVVLILYPLNQIVKSIQLFFISNKGGVEYIIFILTSYMLILFYSGLSLSFLWAIAYFLSAKKRFLIGVFFHPVGIVLYVFVTLFSKSLKYKTLFYASIIFLVFIILETYLIGFFTSGKIANASVDLLNIDMLISYSEKIKSKTTEIKFLLYILIIYLVLYNLKKLIKINLTIFKFNYIVLILACFSMSLTSYMFYKNKKTLLYYIFIENNIDNYSIYTTWFDFGEKNFAITYAQLYDSRYDDMEVDSQGNKRK